MHLQIHVLGCGTSHGVPVLNCQCPVCRKLQAGPSPGDASQPSRNRRRRSSLLIQAQLNNATQSILVDCGPDLYSQVLPFQGLELNAVLLTHDHADHLHGIDELRNFSLQHKLDLYAQPRLLRMVKERFSYIFRGQSRGGRNIPHINAEVIRGPFYLSSDSKRELLIVPIPVWHGKQCIYGFRMGNFAYITDYSTIPTSSMELLQGLDILLIDALRYRPHPTHSNLQNTLSVIKALRPKQAYITHMTHEMDYDQLSKELPAGVAMAYDGLCLDLS